MSTSVSVARSPSPASGCCNEGDLPTPESMTEAPSIDPRFVHRERQPGLDFLRAFAIVVVVIYHTGIFGFALPFRWHRFGWVGVDLFLFSAVI